MKPIYRSRSKEYPAGWYVGERGPFDSEPDAWRWIREQQERLKKKSGLWPHTGLVTIALIILLLATPAMARGSGGHGYSHGGGHHGWVHSRR